MKLRDCKFLTDENIQNQVVEFLISQGLDIQTVIENGLNATDDEVILAFAHQQNRIVLTHDSDFGTLAIAEGKPFFGIIYLKPGHIVPTFTIESLEALLLNIEEFTSPCIVVVQHKISSVRIRVRQV